MSSKQQPTCPTCDTEMQHLPTLDGSGYVSVCPICSDLPSDGSTLKQEEQSEAEQAGSTMGTRFRSLIQEPEFRGFQEIPEELVDDLPDETKKILVDRLTDPHDMPTQELPRQITNSLRDRGYVISEDARGFRISGMPYTGRGDTAELSPGEVVRMAADLEGGTKDFTELQDCPKCEAKSPSTAGTCQWCGHSLNSIDVDSTEHDIEPEDEPQ